MNDSDYTIETHPLREVMTEEEFAQLRRDIQLCKITSWPVCLVEITDDEDNA